MRTPTLDRCALNELAKSGALCCLKVITQAYDGRVQAPVVLRMVLKGLLPVMRAVS
ncbi:hypothetical protein ABID86_007068, partial [Methylobacterium radiotolerans]